MTEGGLRVGYPAASSYLALSEMPPVEGRGQIYGYVGGIRVSGQSPRYTGPPKKRLTVKARVSINTGDGRYTETEAALAEYPGSAGLYILKNLKPGTYTLTTTAPGYLTRTDSGITVVAGLRTRYDLEMFKIGETTISGYSYGRAPLQERITGYPYYRLADLPTWIREWIPTIIQEPAISPEARPRTAVGYGSPGYQLIWIRYSGEPALWGWQWFHGPPGNPWNNPNIVWVADPGYTMTGGLRPGYYRWIGEKLGKTDPGIRPYVPKPAPWLPISGQRLQLLAALHQTEISSALRSQIESMLASGQYGTPTQEEMLYVNVLYAKLNLEAGATAEVPTTPYEPTLTPTPTPTPQAPSWWPIIILLGAGALMLL